MNRQPFLDVLEGWLRAAPKPENLENFANTHPDKWANSMVSLARIAGFTEKSEVQHNVAVTVKHMSDSQLEDELQKRLEELGHVIDVEYADVQTEVAETVESDQKSDEA